MMRKIVMLLVALVLGAITTIAVAWTIALQTRVGGTARFNPVESSSSDVRIFYNEQHRTIWSFQTYRAFGYVEITAGNTGDVPDPYSGVLDSPRLVEARSIPGWSVMCRAAPNEVGSLYTNMHLDQAFGWPWPGLVQHHRVDALNVAVRVDGLATPTFLRDLGAADHVPFRPYWPGFLAGTVLYGAVAYALLWAPGALRRGWRRRDGCCERCGYALRPGALVRCPECGTASA